MILFTFHLSYYIKQLLTIHQDYPVPVDKHGSVKGSKVKYLNFVITKAIVNILAEILNVGRASIDINISNGI